MTDTLLTRRAVFAPTTLNIDARTVTFTISTGASVERPGYIERLDIATGDPRHLVGLPVLDSHRQDSLDRLIGRTVAAGRDARGLWATVRVADNRDDILRGIESGLYADASIGYRERNARESIENGRRVRTVVPSITEISIVVIGADEGAKVRSQTMEDDTETQDRPEDDIVTRAQVNAQIRAAVRNAGLAVSVADELIDAESSYEEAAPTILARMADRSRTARSIRTVAANEDPSVIRTRQGDALFARMTGGAPDDAARPHMTDSLRDMARSCVEAAGISTRGMDPDALFRAAMHTTSDFPNLLTGVGNRTLMATYEAAQSPLKMLARKTTLADFRKSSRLKIGDIGQLQKVSESGEVKSTTRIEAAEGYALDTYASLFSLSRKALINDDLGAFGDWATVAGRAAAETEANLLLVLLTQASGVGPVMGEDNKRLFHTDHGNLAGSGAAPGETTLSAARLAIRTQKGLDGKTPIGGTPKYLLVGPAIETVAEKLLATINPGTSDDANPFAGKLTLLVEPRLAGNSWYVFADPAVLPVLEYAYLSSASGPQIASREGWDVLGMEFRVLLDFGAGAVDFRGAYRNPG